MIDLIGWYRDFRGLPLGFIGKDIAIRVRVKTLGDRPMKEGLMTNAEVSKLLHVSDRTLRRWQISLNFPAYKLGRKTYYFESEIVDFIKSKSKIKKTSDK